MNNGVKFSEDLSLDEMEEVMTEITKNLVNTRLKEGMLERTNIYSRRQGSIITGCYCRPNERK